MAKGNYTVKCNICGFAKSAASEDAATEAAIAHAKSTHRHANPTHLLRSHVTIEKVSRAAKKKK